MTDVTETTTTPVSVEPADSAAPEAPPSHRDLQRASLRDLVALSNECAATEAQLEREYLISTQGEDRRYKQTAAAMEKKYAVLREGIRRAHADKVVEIERKSNSELSALKGGDANARQRISADNDAVENEVKQKLQQATWLADSLLEGTQNQARTEHNQTQADIRNRLAALKEMEQSAGVLLETYAVEPPEAPERQKDSKDAAASVIDKGPAPAADPREAFTDEFTAVEERLGNLKGMLLPKLFVGIKPYIIVIVLLVGAIVGAQMLYGQRIGPEGMAGVQPAWRPIGIAAGGMALLIITLGIVLRIVAKGAVRGEFAPLMASVVAARAAAKRESENAEHQLQSRLAKAQQQRDREVAQAQQHAGPTVDKAHRERDRSMHSVKSEYTRRRTEIENFRAEARTTIDKVLSDGLADVQRQHDAEKAAGDAEHKANNHGADDALAGGKAALERRWTEGLARIQAPIGSTGVNGQGNYDWADPVWSNWNPPKRFPPTVRFGQFAVDIRQITEQVPKGLKLPETFTVPALLAFPNQASLLIDHSDRAARAAAVSTLQLVMMRLLTTIPPGRVRFTIIDPVGLGQNFAGFMHLADYDESLVGTRIWTDADQIEQRLTDLTEHMETVIQKYLRNEFATIDDYNAQAGELAEPYRFLVIADLPTNFSDESFRRLASIASSGARCGVYTLIARDTRLTLPSGAHLEEVQAHSVHLAPAQQPATSPDGFVWKDEVFQKFPLTLDAPPSEEQLTQILKIVGRHAKDSKRVEVPFDSIAPKPDQFWSAQSTDELRVPIGRLGATRLQTLRLGRGVAQHALIAGKTGSGKSTLLHALVTNLSMWYAPQEVEFYLIDFKKGVEFKTYATHDLPHARAIAVESDREFGLSVLQRLDAELARRGELFRKLGVQDIAAYREASGKPLPRTLLIIDEFQEFFSEDDKLAQDAGLLLDRLVRQGRAFGVHVLLGSQTIGGTSGLARSTIGQMAVRIALQTSEADSQLILGDNNSAARLLSRPGEAIYNDQGGLVEGNSPFQIAWLPDERREQYLDEVRKRAAQRARTGDGNGAPAIVFEGNAPADIHKNARLNSLIDASQRPATIPTAPLAWLGEPVAIKDPTGVALRRQSGANALIVGQQEEAALAMLVSSLLSLAAQHPPGGAKFIVLDGTPADSTLSGTFARVKDALPGIDITIPEWRSTPDAINELTEEIHRRQDAEGSNATEPAIYLMVYGLQRYRVLRREEDSFGFSSMSDDGPKKPQPGRQFADLLREGPALGIHVIAWCDTPAAVERTLDRGSLREFDHRVLFQMSAADSSNLIDSPLANKLGFNRALAYSEEQGTVEKFRPYALPEAAFLRHAGEKLQ